MANIFVFFAKSVVFGSFILALPLVYLIDSANFLRIACAFEVYHLTLAGIKLVLAEKLEEWETLTSWMQIIEAPIFGFTGYFLYRFLPTFIEHTFSAVLSWAGPVLVLLEAIQVVRIVMYISSFLAQRATRNEAASAMKAVILTLSATAYIAACYSMYTIYSSPFLTVGMASFVSVLCTLLVVLTIMNIFIDTAIISDAALVSLYCAFVARQALLEYAVPEVILAEAAPIPPSVFDAVVAMATSAVEWMSSLGRPAVNAYSIVSGMFTADSIAGILLALAGILSLALELPYISSEDAEEMKFSSASVSYCSVEVPKGVKLALPNVAAAVAVGMYSRLLQRIAGAALPLHYGWRILQVGVTLGFYMSRVINTARHLHED